MPENFYALENEKDRFKSMPEAYHALESDNDTFDRYV